MAAIATFALKAGVWFRRGRLVIVSPDSLGTTCQLPGRNSTYRPVQISGTGSVVRSHWGVENRLHWRLDVVMNEDQDRSRLGNGPHNLAVLRHMALNVMQKDSEKGSLRGKIKRAGWDEAYLTRLLTLF
jgi:hypothetical protein